MPVSEQALREMLDKQEIFELLRLERFWRDQHEWDKLAASYTEDSLVRVSWFEGTGREFTEASRKMHQGGTRSSHLIFPTLVRINGDRAVAESLGQVQIRGELGGVEYDLVSHCRFLSRLRRTGAGWRLGTFEAIYKRDVMAPVNPSEHLPLDVDQLRDMRPSYRFLTFVLLAGGRQVSSELPGDDRPDLVEALYRDYDRWLESGK